MQEKDGDIERGREKEREKDTRRSCGDGSGSRRPLAPQKRRWVAVPVETHWHGI